MELIVRILLVIVSLIWLSYIQDTNLKFVVVGLALSQLVEVVWLIVQSIKESGENFKSILIASTIHRNKKIRLSCSYLYKIKIDDHYLLVKNSHRSSFQPVGGVYKRTSESDSFLNSILFNEDEKLTNGKFCSKDLRIHIKGKNLQKYLNWYNRNIEREISHSREFYEELITTGVLSKECFPYPTYSFKKRIYTPLKWSKPFQCYELLIYDILELTPNEVQSEELRKLQQQGETDYIKWANAETIRGRGFNNANRKTDYEIGDHATLLIDLEYSKKYMS